jgi:hypothetical protein
MIEAGESFACPEAITHTWRIKDMSTKLVLGFISLVTAALLPAVAFADGAVKVECWGNCSRVRLGQICDTYAPGSHPVAIACDETAVGSGWSTHCSTATCRPFGNLVRSDRLAAYCKDGLGFDAVVSCRAGAAPTQAAGSRKMDDGAGNNEDE